MRTDEQAAAALRERFGAVAPTIPVDPADIVRRGHRRRRATRIAGAVGALALVAALAVGLQGLLPGRTTPEPATPPPAESGPVQLWLSAGEVPTGGVEVGATIISTAPGEPDTFGVVASVDQWDGRGWNRRGEIGMCLDEWQCTGTVTARVDAAEGIGLSARPGMPGPLLRFSTEGLDPGWYRISHEGYAGTVAAGILQVVDGAPAPAPLPPSDQPAISVYPPLVPAAGGVAQIYPVVPPNSQGGLSAEDVADAIADLPRTAQVERWGGEGWTEVATVDVGELPVDADPLVDLVLPELDRGAYRVVRTPTTGGPPHTGSFWVVEDEVAGRLGAPDATAEGGPDSSDTSGDSDGTTERETQADGYEYEPGSPCTDPDPVECALGQWLSELVDSAGYRSLGGDHDVMSASDVVAVDGGEDVVLGLVATHRIPEAWADVDWTDEVALNTPAGPLPMGSGEDSQGTTVSVVRCGGFSLSAAGTDHRQQEVLRAMEPYILTCPTDEDGLLADWADYIAGRTG